MIEEKNKEKEVELPTQIIAARIEEDGKIYSEVNDNSLAYLSKGYGYKSEEENKIVYHPCEVLYLLEKEKLLLYDSKGKQLNFLEALSFFKERYDDIWISYVVFRDLRKRGYVVKEGFSPELRFRVFDRGGFEKGVAKYLIVPLSEGKNVDIATLKKLVSICRGLKKEMIISVVDRRNEVIYYSANLVDLRNL
ncbi:MAG: tRNA-intron lyase [Nitrososphaerota archaeon]